ncbi:MAG: AAA family ATPase [Acidimicrobiaceae bacterium]|nr:AAA family ATPase [Acidimicrobiaceae bacterium]
MLLSRGDRENRLYPRSGLHRIDLRNFKSVLDESVKLSPLTVVVGPNSSGKSTLLQALLAVAQAVRRESTSAGFPLNGEFLDLDTYRKSHNFRASDNSGSITFGLGIVYDIPAGLDFEPSEESEEPYERFQLEFKDATRHVEPDRSPAYYESLIELYNSTKNDSDPSTHVIELDWKVELRESQNSNSDFAEIASFSFVATIFDDGDIDRKSVITLQSGTLARSEESHRNSRVRNSPVNSQNITDLRSGETGYITNSRIEGSEIQFDAVRLAGGLPAAIFARRPCIDQYSRAWWRYRNLEECKTELQSQYEDKLEEVVPEEVSRARRTVIEQAARDVRSVHDGTPGLHALGDDTRELIKLGMADLDESEFKSLLCEELKQESWIDDTVLVHCEDHWVQEILDVVCFMVGDVFGVGDIWGTRDYIPETTEFRYLGPIRKAPQYRHDRGSEYTDIGNDGRYTAEVLYRYSDLLVNVPLPDGQNREIQLGTALNSWLEWFGLADGASAEDQGRHEIGLKVRPEGTEHEVDLTAVGVGVSQALPIILACLLTAPGDFAGDVLVLEQPELHLHPALQQRMADFFLLFVKSGRQILVETHSEHLVNRLRTQVAADDTNRIGELVELLFAEQSGGITSYRDSRINEYGGVSEDWPDGFLDLSAKSAQDLVRAHLQKRARHKEVLPQKADQLEDD